VHSRFTIVDASPSTSGPLYRMCRILIPDVTDLYWFRIVTWCSCAVTSLPSSPCFAGLFQELAQQWIGLADGASGDGRTNSRQARSGIHARWCWLGWRHRSLRIEVGILVEETLEGRVGKVVWQLGDHRVVTCKLQHHLAR